MKLNAEIDGTKHEVEVTRNDGTVKARIDSREYALDVSNPEPGLFVLHDGPSKTIAFVSDIDSGRSMVSIDGNAIEISFSDPKRLRGSGGGGDSLEGVAEIKTAMPGKVVRILTAEGDAVSKGDGVIVVEAMKMQNEMKSPKDGTVRSIRASEGDTVNAGDILVVIE